MSIYTPSLDNSNRARRKGTRSLYRAIRHSRYMRTFHTVGGLDITTKEAAHIAKMTRQSSRTFRNAASYKRSEEAFYAMNPY
jgi:hypothetical protein